MKNEAHRISHCRKEMPDFQLGDWMMDMRPDCTLVIEVYCFEVPDFVSMFVMLKIHGLSINSKQNRSIPNRAFIYQRF